MVEVDGGQIIQLINQTQVQTSKLAEQMSATQDSYLLYIVISAVMSSFIYLYLFGRPLLLSLAWHTKVRSLVRQYSVKTGRGVMLMTHAQTGLFGSMITMQDAIKIERALRKFNKANMPVDFIVNTFGGELFASLRIAHMLKNNPQIRVIVPKYAWSGGSLISISASQILANSTSIFGAVDPQLGNLLWSFSAKDWKHIVDTKTQELKGGASTGAKDETIAMAQMSSRLMKEMESYVGELVADKPNLNKSMFFDLFLNGDHTHAHILSPHDLRKCGLDVQDLDTDIPDMIIEKMRNNSGVYAYGKGIKFNEWD